MKVRRNGNFPKIRAPAAHAVLARFDEKTTHTERRVLQEGKR
jgi:hypothetical protein